MQTPCSCNVLLYDCRNCGLHMLWQSKRWKEACLHASPPLHRYFVDQDWGLLVFIDLLSQKFNAVQIL